MRSKAIAHLAADSPQESEGSLIRLQRLLALAGVDSRRHCEEYIQAGRVTVDGVVVRELGVKVDPARQRVLLDSEPIIPQRKVYYLLNKPPGVVCTNRDPAGRPRVIDLFRKQPERLFTVGRLDEDSQGLLLVTNDGEMAEKLAHPRYRVPKCYRVQVAGVPSREDLDQLRSGLYFPEGKFRVDDVRLMKTKGRSAILQIVLMEGQNREIRRMLARLGHKVMRLERIGFGPLMLGDLPRGVYRALTKIEVDELHRCVRGELRYEPKSRADGRVRRPRRGKGQPRDPSPPTLLPRGARGDSWKKSKEKGDAHAHRDDD
jgi:23S rRNA pseudouridine2605 synthase